MQLLLVCKITPPSHRKLDGEVNMSDFGGEFEEHTINKD